MNNKIGQSYYFVYMYFTDDGNYGFGADIVKLSHDIPTAEDIVDTTNNIKSNYKYSNIILINWLLIDDFSEDTSEENKE